VTEVAARLGVSTNWVNGRIRRGVIHTGRDEASGRHTFPDTDAALEALRHLQSGTIKRLDLTPHHHEQEGH
jgi:hypothetical protein